MAYRLVFERAAEKALKKRIRPDQAELLAEDPYPRASGALQNTENRRLRIGEYRVIYFAEEPDGSSGESGALYVLDIGHRQGIYV